jgi:hypothetical protein
MRKLIILIYLSFNFLPTALGQSIHLICGVKVKTTSTTDTKTTRSTSGNALVTITEGQTFFSINFKSSIQGLGSIHFSSAPPPGNKGEPLMIIYQNSDGKKWEISHLITPKGVWISQEIKIDRLNGLVFLSDSRIYAQSLSSIENNVEGQCDKSSSNRKF